jgi:pyruvate dehydrogenase E1 component beta subunit
VGVNGGVSRHRGPSRFGFKRVIDTPLAEGLIAGVAVGMATQGLKPVAEFQFQGFIFPGMEQIICQAARMRNRTRGRITCPIVYRSPYGAGIHRPSTTARASKPCSPTYPGLRVVIP